MIPFVPLFRNPHLQTIAGHLWPRHGEEGRFPIHERLYRTEPDVQVLVQSQHPERPAGDVIIVHGLEGSGEAGYMRSLSGAALRAGFSAHRFHMRTCGGTEHLCRTLYHAGLTTDLCAVVRDLIREGHGPVFLVGFSLGGNVVLKLTGELGDEARPLIRGVCAVSAPLDLAACARRIGDRENRIYERRIGDRENRIYERRFVGRMQARLRATGQHRHSELAGMRSVMEIDDRVTAPAFGFGTAAHYYSTQSAMRYLSGIRVPTLLIYAKDDTLVPFSSVAACREAANPKITLLACEHGGHLGFIGRKPHRFWADVAVMQWIRSHAPAAA